MNKKLSLIIALVFSVFFMASHMSIFTASASAESVVDVFMENYFTWKDLAFSQAGDNGVAFLDIDFDGELELVVGSCGGSGIMTMLEFYKIVDGNVVQLTTTAEAFPDVTGENKMKLYKNADGKKEYYGTDIYREGAAYHSEIYSSFAYRSETNSVELTDYYSVSTYTHNDQDSLSWYDYQTDKDINETEYNKLKANLEGSLTDLNLTYKFVDIQKLSDSEVKTALIDSYKAFSYTGFIPSEPKSEEKNTSSSETVSASEKSVIIDALVETYPVWSEFAFAKTPASGIMFLDIDFDGELELVVSNCDGSGQRTDLGFYKVVDGKVTRFGTTTDDFPDVTGYLIGGKIEMDLYRNADGKKEYYGTDELRVGWSHSEQIYSSFAYHSEEDAVVRTDYYSSIIETDENDKKTYSWHDYQKGKDITETEYNKLKKQINSNLTDLKLKFKFISIQDISDSNIRQSLIDSYEAFSYRGFTPSESGSKENTSSSDELKISDDELEFSEDEIKIKLTSEPTETETSEKTTSETKHYTSSNDSDSSDTSDTSDSFSDFSAINNTVMATLFISAFILGTLEFLRKPRNY